MWGLLVFLFPITVLGQKVDRRLVIDLKEYNISFKMPKGYAECDSGFAFYCGDQKITNAITYSIVKKDSSVKIGFSFIPNMSKSDFDIIKRLHSNAKLKDENDNYLNSAYIRADTINHKITFYNPAFTKKTFNADHALAITRNCNIPEGNFNNNRILYVAKDKRCHIELTYLYTDRRKKHIEGEIRKTIKDMISFND